jgi:peroxiredoxin
MSGVPSTIEGAYLLHTLFRVDWAAWGELKGKKQDKLMARSSELLDEMFARKEADESGAAYHVLGHKGDLMFIFARQTPDELAVVERQLAKLPIWPYLEPTYSYFSVIELSLHGVAERYRAKLLKQGVEENTPAWDAALEELLDKDRETQRPRLYPEIPADRYVCFYPMDKKRGEVKNWFMLDQPERSSLMAAHGKTGRKYFGKISQVISSSMGLDDYDWGVDLFAQDPLQFKKLIYEMRFDEVSAIYAEFGPFIVGIRLESDQLLRGKPHFGVKHPEVESEEKSAEG